jgi:hypothetical protein
MNLIQIQEHLKDLPVQVIQSYANGANPEVPPYMALAEMQRRQTMDQRVQQQQQANAASIAPTAPLPVGASVTVTDVQAWHNKTHHNPIHFCLTPIRNLVRSKSSFLILQ